MLHLFCTKAKQDLKSRLGRNTTMEAETANHPQIWEGVCALCSGKKDIPLTLRKGLCLKDIAQRMEIFLH